MLAVWCVMLCCFISLFCVLPPPEFVFCGDFFFRFAIFFVSIYSSLSWFLGVEFISSMNARRDVRLGLLLLDDCVLVARVLCTV